MSHEQALVWDMEPGRPTTFELVSGQAGGSVSVFKEVVPTGDSDAFRLR